MNLSFSICEQLSQLSIVNNSSGWMPVFDDDDGKPWDEVVQYFNRLVGEVNATLPTTHRVAKVTVRKEDFKRTGAMKVSRNQA